MEQSEKLEEGMSVYSYFEDFNKSVLPEKISYGDAGFRNFDFREVFVNDKPKGEYYIKIRNSTPQAIANAVVFLTNRLKDCEVGIIDPSQDLRLEFHIYIKTNNDMLKEVMLQTMEGIDIYISSLKSNKK